MSMSDIHLSIISRSVTYESLKKYNQDLELFCETQDSYRDFFITEPEVVIAVVTAGSLVLNNLIKQIFLLLREKNSKSREVTLKIDGVEIFTKNINAIELNDIIEKSSNAKESVEILEKS